MASSSAADVLLLLQLADGTFPSGGFAHSSGLEASVVLGGAAAAAVVSVESFLDASIHQVGRATLPFVRSAALAPDDLAPIDARCDATLCMLAPNHASRAQGRALASAASRIFEARVRNVSEHVRNSGPAHHGPIFGAVFGSLGVGVDETLIAYLHGAARNVLSAAVRLGLLGPLEAQRLLASRAPIMAAALERSKSVAIDDAAHTAPLIELFAALHDRLDGRMFQS